MGDARKSVTDSETSKAEDADEKPKPGKEEVSATGRVSASPSLIKEL